jgi:predicted aspartyl protease
MRPVRALIAASLAAGLQSMAMAQETGARPSAADEPIPAAAQTMALGTDRAKRLTVPVSIAGSGPYRFVVDTGAERTVISRELAATLNLPTGSTAQLHTVAGARSVETKVLAGLSVSRAAAIPVIAPALPERALGAHGILGVDTLKDKRVLLDFKSRQMTVEPASRRVQSIANDDDDAEIVVRARRREGRLVISDARVQGRNVAIVVDTGAEYSIGNPALLRAVMKRRPGIALYPITLIGVTGEEVAAQVAVIEDVQLGSLTLANTPIAFADVLPFRTLGLARRPALLLGMNTMQAFDKVAVDFSSRSVRFLIPGGAALGTDTRYAMLATRTLR